MKTILFIAAAALLTLPTALFGAGGPDTQPLAAAPVVDQQQLASTMALAASGDPVAVNRLGAWYEKGINVAADPTRAALLYRQAAQAGNAVAQNNLGVLYNRGVGVALDKKMAAYWYAKAAEQGHGWAQANLAYAYQYGTLGEPDMDQALYWLTRSAEGGLADAQARLGVLLMRRAATDEERVAAATWIARAAEQNSPKGMYYLGRSYELGLGKVQDDARAAAHYRAALGRSDGRAETALAMLIDAGRDGSPDEERVMQLYLSAMGSRYRPAFYQYGLIMERRGDPMAAAVFLRGAELGDCQAMLKTMQLQAAGADFAGRSPAADLAQRAEFCVPPAGLPPQL
jgi:TPR repeat protein